MYAVLVQARLSSERFPDKVIANIAGKPMIIHILDRLRILKQQGHQLIVASPREADESLKHIVRRWMYDYQAPDVDENDVLGRFAHIVKDMPVDGVIRITGDCPLIDPKLILTGIRLYEETSAQFVTLGKEFPEGLDFEIMSKSLLLHANKYAVDGPDREHVTPYIWGVINPSTVTMHADRDCGQHCWSVDTPDDLEFVRAIYAFVKSTDWREVARFLTEVDFKDLYEYSISRVKNESYLKQIGSEKNWNQIRYGS